jgi:hypothetical protein
MTDLPSLPLDLSEAVFGLVAFFIINVLINLFLVHKVYEERQRSRKLTRQQKDEKTIIRDFLEQQHQQTRSYTQRLGNPIGLEKEMIYLRAAYMKLESNALVHEANTEPYWAYINEQLKKVIKATALQSLPKDDELKELQNKIVQLKERIVAIPGEKDEAGIREKKERIVALLDNLAYQHAQSVGDRSRLKNQVNKIEHLVQLFEDQILRQQYTLQKHQESYIKNSQMHLEALQDNHLVTENNIRSLENSFEKEPATSALEVELQHFRDENNKLNLHVEELKKELRKLQNRVDNSDTPGQFIATNEKKKSAGYDLFSLSEELLASSEKEIDRLHDVIAKQRRSITEMGGSLTNLQQLSTTETSDHKAEIEKLQRCIQESEVCIGMLEQELEDLRSDLDTIRHQRDGAGISLAEADQLGKELNTIKVDLEKAVDKNRRGDAIIEFVREALNASSVEDISLLIYENITSLGYPSCLIVKAPERFIEMAQQNSVSTKDKLLLNNMQINEINPGRGGHLTFRFLNIAGLVRPAAEDDIDSEDQAYILDILKIADRIIGHLAATQKAKSSFKTVDNVVSGLKQTSYELDQLLEDSAKKTKKLVSSNFTQLQDTAKAKGLGASHIAEFAAIQQETLRQLEAESSVRVKLRQKFLALLNQLEK